MGDKDPVCDLKPKEAQAAEAILQPDIHTHTGSLCRALPAQYDVVLWVRAHLNALLHPPALGHRLLEWFGLDRFAGKKADSHVRFPPWQVTVTLSQAWQTE